MTRKSPSSRKKIRFYPRNKGVDGKSPLAEVYRGENPNVDIVAIHGPNGSAPGSFTAKDSGHMWLGDNDMLPRDVKDCRVLTYSYFSSIAKRRGSTSSDGVLQHAQTLVAELAADRQLEGAPERPIIFVCHSLGGIIVKRALIYSASRTSHMLEHIRSIYVSTYGILFLGTPHHGTDQANRALFCQRIANIVFPSKLIDTDSQLLKAMRTGSEILQEITDNFAPLMKNFRIYFFWEQEKTNLGFTWDYIVPESSAAPIHDNTERAGLQRKHQDLCRFGSRKTPGYKLVAACLVRYAAAARECVPRKWDAEKAVLALMRRKEADHLLAQSACTPGYSITAVEPIDTMEKVSCEDRPGDFLDHPTEAEIAKVDPQD